MAVADAPAAVEIEVTDGVEDDAVTKTLALKQGCQMAKFDPFLSLDCVRVEGVGDEIQGKEGIKFCSVA